MIADVLPLSPFGGTGIVPVPDGIAVDDDDGHRGVAMAVERFSPPVVTAQVLLEVGAKGVVERKVIHQVSIYLKFWTDRLVVIILGT